MMNKNIKDTIDSRLDSVRVSAELEEKILNKSFTPKKKKVKPFAAIAVACLCMVAVLTAVPVLAATVPGFNALLSRVSPEIAQFLQPIQLECEYDGIKMEVVAAMNDDESLIIYLTMQDLTGNRIDDAINLLQYKILDAGHNNHISFSHEIVAYDESTNTATLRLSTTSSASNINGKKITISIDSFLSGKKAFDEFDTDINLADYASGTNTIELDLSTGSRSYGGIDNNNARFIKDSKITVLKPDELNIPLPDIDFANISNIGVVDGMLHVQLRFTDTSTAIGIQNSGTLYLTDISGNIYPQFNLVVGGIDGDGKAYDIFVKDGDTMYGVNGYHEYIFDVDTENLSSYRLIGDLFATFSTYTSGKWQTTFKIESVKQTKLSDCTIDCDGLIINRLSLSPIGITITGIAEDSYNTNVDIFLLMSDGSVLRYGAGLVKQIIDGDTSSSFTNTSGGYDDPRLSCTTYSHEGKNGELIIKFITRLPFDIDSVVSATINGIDVTFK